MAIQRPKFKLHRGSTYVFDMSDPSLAGHPLRFTNDSGTSEYTTGVTAAGSPGSANATVTFDVPIDAPDNLMYYCSTHGIGMGNKIKTIDDPANEVAWGGARGFWYGGTIRPESTNIKLDDIDYVTISTPANAQDFGDLVRDYTSLAGCSNSNRALTAAGGTGTALGSNDITYFQTATQGSTGDFGDLLGSTFSKAGLCDGAANTDRGLFSGGNYSADRRIEYVTVSTPGNSQDFGDLSVSNGSIKNHAGAADDTRGLFLGGFSGWFLSKVDTIDYITIATLSDAMDFGDLLEITNQNTACSNKTRALNWCGVEGTSSSNKVNRISYVTIQTTGNATDFGDANNEVSIGAACSNGIYGVMGGGATGWSSTFQRINNIDYVIVDTTGNATDFGDLTDAKNSPGSAAGKAA
jgi:hypothetical protein|tara:strand:- start:56 stop:1282 length:1227 start_codon:yes stop_codon:yes gene_type:complete